MQLENATSASKPLKVKLWNDGVVSIPRQTAMALHLQRTIRLHFIMDDPNVLVLRSGPKRDGGVELRHGRCTFRFRMPPELVSKLGVGRSLTLAVSKGSAPKTFVIDLVRRFVHGSVHKMQF